MKYIKSYFKHSSELDEMVSDLKNILLDIKDEGFMFDAEVIKIEGDSEPGIRVWISRHRRQDGFVQNEEEYSMLKSELNRFKNFVESNGYKLKSFTQPGLLDVDYIRATQFGIDKFNNIMDANRYTMNFVIKKNQ